MGAESVGYGPVRLRRIWRRALVCIGAGAAALAFIAGSWTGTAPSVAMASRVASGAVGAIVLWFLADVLRPWVLEPDDVAAAELGRAEQSIRQAYRTLFAAALGVLLWQFLGGPANPVLFWPFLWAVLLLPIGIAAWTVPDDIGGGAPVGPLRLIRARLRGEAALPYRLGAAAAGICLALPLVAYAEAIGVPTVVRRGGLLVAVGLAVVGGVLFLRALLEHSLDRSDRRSR